MQSVHGTSVKSMEVDGDVAHHRLRESTATRVINANGRHIMFGVIVLLLAFLVQTVPTTLMVIFTRDLYAKVADGSVSGHNLAGAIDLLTDRKGSPVTSGNTLFQLNLVSNDKVEEQAKQLVGPESIGRMNTLLSSIDTLTLGMGNDNNPINFGYRVRGFVQSNEATTLKLNGATGDLDFHLTFDKENDNQVIATIGDANYAGPGHMKDGRECRFPCDRRRGGS